MYISGRGDRFDSKNPPPEGTLSWVESVGKGMVLALYEGGEWKDKQQGDTVSHVRWTNLLPVEAE